MQLNGIQIKAFDWSSQKLIIVSLSLVLLLVMESFFEWSSVTLLRKNEVVITLHGTAWWKVEVENLIFSPPAIVITGKPSKIIPRLYSSGKRPIVKFLTLFRYSTFLFCFNSFILLRYLLFTLLLPLFSTLLWCYVWIII